MLYLFSPFKAKILFTVSAEEQLFILPSMGLQSFVIVILMTQNTDAVNEVWGIQLQYELQIICPESRPLKVAASIIKFNKVILKNKKLNTRDKSERNPDRHQMLI